MPRKPKEISFIEGKNVSLVGFNKFDKVEKKSVINVMNVYIKKIEERIDYDELKIRLKQHQRNKMFFHEMSAELFINPGSVLSAKFTHKNPYKALSQVMVKLINSIVHQQKKSQRGKSKKLTEKLSKNYKTLRSKK